MASHSGIDVQKNSIGKHIAQDSAQQYNADTQNFYTSNDDMECLRMWRLTDPAEDKSRIMDTKDTLLADSCAWVFDDPAFTSWFNDDESGILWIHGDPGKGKTMMVMAAIDEISRRLESTGRMMSYFFFQSSMPNLNNASAMVRGLTYLLCKENPTLRRYLHQKYAEAGKTLFEGPNALYSLWMTLLKVLEDQSVPRYYLLVDALDECDSQSLQSFLRLLAKDVPGLNKKVKWILTSRNEPQIMEQLHGARHSCDTNLELNSSHVAGAVKRFIASRVNDLATLKNYDLDLAKNIQDHLEAHADGTFLWVSLVCKELKKARTPRKALEACAQFPKGLGPLYRRMMEQINQDDDMQELHKVLHTMALSCRPLGPRELGVLARLKHPDEALYLVQSCASFLTVQRQDQKINFVHKSAKDYFADDRTVGLIIFPQGRGAAQKELAHSLLSIMRCLKGDICGVQSPGFGREDLTDDAISIHLPDFVQYACSFWVNHLTEGVECLYDDEEVHLFLQEYLLYWIEALGWMAKMSDGIRALISLEAHVKADITPNLHNFIHDAKRFMLFNRQIIEMAPLQLYCSSLVFAPQTSIVRNQFDKDIPRWITTRPTVPSHWSAALQTLEGHSEEVTTVAFSPDGKSVASGSGDSTVRLWDAATGAALQTLEGHSGPVTTVAFSPDGKSVASGSWDSTVRLWDAATGAALQTLEGHSEEITTVAFSPDGKSVASGSGDSTVRLWDAATGAALQTLEGHSGGVNTVAFSPDGKSVASGSGDSTTFDSLDSTVRLWDAATGAALQTLEGHSEEVTTVAFSPDGKSVVSGSCDNTVRLWDAATGAALQTLEGHSSYVSSVAFSPDGKSVASGSGYGDNTALDSTVRLWDAATGAALQSLKGHSGPVNTVAFSPDGKSVASGSGDSTVRLWDAATGAALQTLEGHSEEVTTVAFSPDGKSVASGSGDSTVRLWEAATGAALQMLEWHSIYVSSVDFSPDGKSVASGSWDSTVRLWDAATGAALQTLEGHSQAVSTVVFSPDGKSVASGSWDSTVRLWDAATGAALQTLEGHSGPVTTVAFSPDGKSVASGSRDSTVRLWDVATGAALQTLEGHSQEVTTFAFFPDGVTTVAFSPDGKSVVSGSWESTLRLWDAATGAALQTLGDHSSYVSSVASESVVQDEWILKKGKRLLWLPPEYRSTKVLVHNSLVCLKLPSERVIFVGFKYDLV